ncbi:uncharacterized protein Mst57Da [Palaemon carinicauda]|uniref:uncharacterized protein Mst57Da n=1 Tax=Palaemon carinicauda TaxID=392227 RepID=UPI0035B601E5
MMAKALLTLTLLGVSQVFLTWAKPWELDSHEIFYSPVRSSRIPAVAYSAVVVPAWRSSVPAAPAVEAAPAPAAPAPAPAAPAAPPTASQAELRSAPAQRGGVPHLVYAIDVDDSREFGYDGGLDLSHEVGLVAYAPGNQQVW